MSETVTTRPKRAAVLDAVCRDAVDLARTALVQVVPPEHVGEHLGVQADEERIATHRFVRGSRQWTHFPHSGAKSVTTWSPGATRVTSAPTASTTPAPS